MKLFAKKETAPVLYTFNDFCNKQIALYESLLDNDTDPKNRGLYESMIGRYTTMRAEYSRYKKEVEFMERKVKNES